MSVADKTVVVRFNTIVMFGFTMLLVVPTVMLTINWLHPPAPKFHRGKFALLGDLLDALIWSGFGWGYLVFALVPAVGVFVFAWRWADEIAWVFAGDYIRGHRSYRHAPTTWSEVITVSVEEGSLFPSRPKALIIQYVANGQEKRLGLIMAHFRREDIEHVLAMAKERGKFSDVNEIPPFGI